jgi:hypothetical protein
MHAGRDIAEQEPIPLFEGVCEMKHREGRKKYVLILPSALTFPTEYWEHLPRFYLHAVHLALLALNFRHCIDLESGDASCLPVLLPTRVVRLCQVPLHTSL